MRKFNKRIFILFALVNLAFTFSIAAQEICDNGIDDDGDGLVDINDPDCACEGFTDYVTSTIPNPSFEQNMACPNAFSQMDLVTNWENASSSPFSSTDYIHSCGFMTENFITPPTPFPDGQACIGLMSYNKSSFIHEYVGTCLPTEPLEKDTSYTLNFYVGFGIQTLVDPSYNLDSVYSESPAYFTLYGNADCSQFPFPASTCPTDFFNSNWEPIDTIEVFGKEEWVMTGLKFTPEKDYRAIVLGAPCGSKSLGDEVQYYFIDNLILSKTSNFIVGAPTKSGSICDSSLAISSPIVGAGFNYQWYKDGVAISGANSLTLNLGGGDIDGAYQVMISKGSECEISLPIDISSSSDNNLSILGPRGICPGDSVMLEATSGFTSYRWSTGDTSSTIVVSDGGIYSVSVSDGNGCNFDAEFSLFGPIDIDPQASVENATGTNDNGSITLNPTGGISPYFYQWSVPGSGPSINNLSEGRYFVTITDDIGCQHLDSFDIEFVPNDFEFKFEVKNLDCFEDSSGRLKVEMTGGYPPFEILWSTGSIQDEIRNLSAGKYSVSITNNIGETKTYETFLTQPAPLEFSKIRLQQPLCNGDQNGQIEVSIQGGTLPYNYSWSGGTSNTETLRDINAGSYTISVVDENGCELNRTLSLPEPELLKTELSFSEPSCFGLEDGFIDIEKIEGGVGAYTVLLNGTPISLKGADDLSQGTYALLVEDENGCQFTRDIILDTPPRIEIEALTDKSRVMQGEDVRLNGIIRPGSLTDFSLLWTANTADPQIECDNCLETISRPARQTIYTLQLTKNGCTYTDAIEIEVSNTTFYMPNAFSPNGDGINDYFTFASNFGEGLMIKELVIFDRWGSLVHTVRNIPVSAYEGWDGRRNNELLESDVYVYRVTLENGRGEVMHYAGDVFLK